MGLFGAHQGHDSGKSPTSIFAQNLAVVLAGFFAAYVAFTKVIPNDLFTSALFFDALNLEVVFGRPAPMFAEGGIWADLPDVTEEAFVFALSLMLIQFLIGYRASVAGGYTRNSSNIFSLVLNFTKGTEKLNGTQLNWGKVGWVAFYWAISMLDTYTDTAYRSGFWQQGAILRTLVISFFYYNLASEWMLMVGIKTVIDYGVRLVSDIKNISGGIKFSSFPGSVHTAPRGRDSRQSRDRRDSAPFPR